MANLPLMYNSGMSPRCLMVVLILGQALFAQLSPNAVTVTVSQATSVTPGQAAFSVTVTSGFNKTLDQIVGALSGTGITAANLGFLSSTNNVPVLSTAQAQPMLGWNFQLVVPFSKQAQISTSLTTLQSTIGQNNSGLSLSFNVGTLAATPSSQNCDLATLVSNARTQAQSLASAAGLSAGAIVQVTSAISNSLFLPCSLTVGFGLGSASWQPTVNTITIVASETNALPLDQVTTIVTVTSGPTAVLDDVTGALQGAGITSASFSGVSEGPMILATGPDLNWSFTLVVPLSKLNSTLTQLTNGQQAIQRQSAGLSLTFFVSGLSSSQAQQPSSCPEASLVAEAQTQAQQVATAATLSVGPILAMSGSQSLSASPSAVVVEGGVLTATTSTPTGFATLTSGGPLPVPAPVCSVRVQYQLLY